jgi:hypothetical protein
LHGDATETLEDTIARLHGPDVLQPLALDTNAAPAVPVSRYTREAFERDVDRIKEYILAGDVFQVLLARRMELELDFDPTSLYRTLRAINPSPYMYHLVLDGLELVGSSPELLVRVADGRMTVRPIAGTRPRGRTSEEDHALAAELLADEKERAEHVMLVDLGRNDVGRLARYGTVRVTDLMTVERYSHVFHIVSQVEGRIVGRRERTRCVSAPSSPAGTMTGAPKVRAMEIIDELDPSVVARTPVRSASSAPATCAWISRLPFARASSPTAWRRCKPVEASCTTRCRRASGRKQRTRRRALLTAIGRVRAAQTQNAHTQNAHTPATYAAAGSTPDGGTGPRIRGAGPPLQARRTRGLVAGRDIGCDPANSRSGCFAASTLSPRR